jgi:outer membrane protein insertion porin family/translocation and assembly module TamA
MSCRPFRQAFGLVVALALVPLSLAGQENEDEIERPEVKRLELTGVKSVEKSELEESIATTESHCRSLLLKPLCLIRKTKYWYEREYIDRDEIARDVLRIRVFYWKRGFREATVDTTVTPNGRDGINVKFAIKEGPPTLVQAVRVTRPDKLLTDRQVDRIVVLDAGRPFNLLQLDSTVVRLQNALWDRGYSDAIVDDTVSVDPDARTAWVGIGIDPRWQARVGEIFIEGNEQISERTIRNSLTLRTGDIYRRSELIRSQRNLYESNLFRHASILVPPQGDTVKQLEVTLREAPLREARLGGGFNTIEYVQLDGRLTHYNWFGSARRLELQGGVGNLLAQQLSGQLVFRDLPEPDGDTPDLLFGDGGAFRRPTWQASAQATQPWFRSPHNSISLGIFAHRRTAPSIFIDRAYGASATFTRQMAVRAPVSLSYRFEVTKVEAGDVYFCVNYGVCDDPTIAALRGRQNLSPLTLTGSIDRSNDPFAPTAGYVLRADAEHASGFTGSDFRYNRATADGSVYRRLSRRFVLASRLRLGIVRSLESTSEALQVGGGALDVLLHPRKRFYAGGARSVRGYGENQLGPRILTIDPQSLRGDSTGSDYCPTTTAIQFCDPNRVDVSKFNPRPIGGNAIAEASAELRFGIWGDFSGAVFLDGALVGSESSLTDLGSAAGALTPGFGVRYKSPVGPIRVDLGINPSLSEDLQVLTQAEGTAQREIILLRRPDGRPALRTYAPTEGHSGLRGILNRLTLHLSIGEAY